MSSPLSIVFCGTPEFAVPSLTVLFSDPAFAVKLVITQPDKPVGRKQRLTPPPVKVLAEMHGIPICQPKDINDRASSFELRASNCDFLIAVAFGQILSSDILSIPRIAAVNLHPSLLPRWRGASPIQHALLAGERETGVTLQSMTEALDAGPILAQEVALIAPTDTAATLSKRLASQGAALLSKTLKEPLHPVPQEESRATFCRKLTRKDGAADPRTMTAEEIDRRVRALTPWPGVTCPINGETVKLLVTSRTGEPESLSLPCAENTTLFITELQPPGKKPMSGAAWKRGHPKKPEA